MRKQLIAGNWKMHNTVAESVSLVKSLKEQIPAMANTEVLVCVPFTALDAVHSELKGSAIQLGAQNMFYEEQGAFTGEISPTMIRELGCTYVIIGHSERRQLFGESDALLNKKLQAAFAHGITPILCVGETLAQREAGEAISHIETQLKLDLANLAEEKVATMVIAYEPIWAIGTGKTATAAQAEEMCAAIRAYLASLYSPALADVVRIQYGGSVKGSNAEEILSQANIDGALVGGAALSVDGFMPIVKR